MQRNHKLFSGSSYDRGVEHILRMWPDIKREVPDATLDIYYGWNLYESAYRTNPERMAWMKKMQDLMTQEGVKEHGRVGKEELRKARQECGIWAYSTHFTEINCITALECGRDGCVPVVMNLAALKETVGSGVKVDGDIYFDEDFEKYRTELISLMKDEKRWKEEQAKGIEFAKQFTWDIISKKWEEEFDD